MNADDRVDRWTADLVSALDAADELVARGRAAFDDDIAIRLAFEALSARIGEIAKRLLAADPSRFSDPSWRAAARNRDFVVHHYDRVDDEALWRTATEGFPQLRSALGGSVR